MYISLGVIWIISVLLLLLGSASVVWIFRQVYKNRSGDLIAKEKELLELKKAIDLLLFEASHNGLNPVMKRFRGLLTLLIANRRKIKECLEQAIKPNHHKWAELVQKYFKEIEIELDYTETVCKQAEGKLTESIKRLNELL